MNLDCFIGIVKDKPVYSPGIPGADMVIARELGIKDGPEGIRTGCCSFYMHKLFS